MDAEVDASNDVDHHVDADLPEINEELGLDMK